MSILEKPTTNGFSGFKTIQYAFIEDIDSLLLDISNLLVLESNIVFKAGKSWNNLYFTPGTLNIEEKEKDNEGGKIIDFDIKLNYPGDTRSSSSELEMMRNRLYLIKIVDMNNNSFLYGTDTNPFSMSVEKKKGSSPSGAKHYEISFNGSMLNSAIYIV